MTLQDSFLGLKSNLEPSETHSQSIQRRHNAVRSIIEGKYPGARTQLIGSLQRQTRIAPNDDDKFDIDILVELGSFNRWGSDGVTPDMAMAAVHGVLEESDRYASMNPVQDHPTVSLSYSDDVDVEIVPAYKDNVGACPAGNSHFPIGRAYWVPDGQTWKLADYDHEANQVSAANQKMDGLLIPTIKMLKDLKRKYFSIMKSFHLEVLAVDILPSVYQYYLSKGEAVTYSKLISGFFALSKEKIMQPVRMPGSLSPLVTLEPQNQLIIKNAFEAVDRYCSTEPLLETAAKKHWRELFKDSFPSV